MKVKATKSIHFPSLDWGISAGATRELPEDEGAQEIILAHPNIKPVGETERVEPKIINKSEKDTKHK